jgi:hypothetical protein
VRRIENESAIVDERKRHACCRNDNKNSERRAIRQIPKDFHVSILHCW